MISSAIGDILICVFMKAVTINVAEPVYTEFQRMARRRRRSTSQLIREAMERYLREEKQSSHSILDLEPLSAGSIRKSFDSRAGLAGELFDDLRH